MLALTRKKRFRVASRARLRRRITPKRERTQSYNNDGNITYKHAFLTPSLTFHAVVTITFTTVYSTSLSVDVDAISVFRHRL